MGTSHLLQGCRVLPRAYDSKPGAAEVTLVPGPLLLPSQGGRTQLHVVWELPAHTALSLLLRTQLPSLELQVVNDSGKPWTQAAQT